MSTVTKNRLVTFEDFCTVVKADQKADLIDGVIYVAAPDNTDANELTGWIYCLMLVFVRARKLGKVYLSRVLFRFAEHQAAEPDVAFVRTDRLSLVEGSMVNGSPDLTVEVVSPDSVDRDYEKKRRQYQDAGVPEYWIVDEIEQKVTLLRLDAKGHYREIRPRKGVLRSEVLSGFWLRPEWLWQEPLPEPADVLAQLLPD